MKEAGIKSLKGNPELGGYQIERRRDTDRRSSSGTTHHFHLVGGRRKNSCRRSGQYNYFVDRYDPVLFAVVTGIMLMSAIDAFITTIILSAGGEEVNLLMDWVIQKDIYLFASVKFSLTGLGLILLTRYIHFKIFYLFKVFHFMLAVFVGYTVLIVYEVFFFI